MSLRLPIALLLVTLAAPVPALAQQTISIDFRGTLSDALQQIAEAGGLNLVVTGELDQDAQVRLSGVTAEEALRSVAVAWDLELVQSGKVWTLRPASSVGRAQPPQVLADPDPAPPVTEERTGRGRGRSRDRTGTGTVVISEGEVVDNAVAFGGGVVVNGVVRRDAVAFGGDVRIGPKGVVRGDAVAFGGSVHRESGAQVQGDSLAFGGAVLGQAVSAGVKELSPKARARGPDAEARRDRRTPAVVGALVWFVILFGIGFVAAMLMPTRMKVVGQQLRASPLRSGLTGLLATLALFPLSILLMVTLIGIPIAFALWLLAMVAAVVGFAAVAAELGRRLPFFKGRKTQALVLASGLAVVIGVGFVPVLGPLALTFLAFMGFGAIVRTRFGGRGGGPAAQDADLPTGVPV
jgi:uncharacterized membrane protein